MIKNLKNLFKPSNIGFILNVFIKFFSVLLSFVINFMVIRLLSVEDYGQYSYIFYIVQLVSLPSVLLNDKIITKYSPKLIDENDHEFNFFNLRLLFFLVFVPSLGILFLETSNYIKFLIVFFSLFLALITYLSRILNVSRQLIKGFIVSTLSRQVILFIIVLYIYLNADTLNFEELLGYNFLSSILVVAAVLLLYFKIPIKLNFFEKITAIQFTWIKYASFILIFGVSNFFRLNMDIFMLKHLMNYEAVGIYDAMFKLSSLIGVSVLAIEYTLGPIISRSLTDKKALKKNIVLSTTLTAFIGCFIFIVLLLFGKEIINFIFGIDYARGINVLLILSIGNVIHAVTAPVINILMYSGEEKLVAKTSFYVVFVLFALNFPCIKYYGIEGAAATYSLGVFLQSGFLSIKSLKYIR